MSVRLDTVKLDQIIARFPFEAEGVVARGAMAVSGYAKSDAPVDTGALKASISTERKEDLLHWVSDGVEYGIYQEFGTYKMSAHPFMRPAVERAQPQYTALWVELFNRL